MHTSRTPGEAGAGAVALHCGSMGEGPVVALLHGFGGSGRNFRPQARALRDRFRVLFPDLRGHARSPAPASPEAYLPACFVADLARLLDDAGCAEAVVGGLSFGASVALRFALRHPERVRGLVLASYPAARHGGGIASVARRFADAIDARGLESAGAEFVWGPRSGFDPAAARWVKQGFLEHPPHALAHILRQYLAEEPPLDALAGPLAALDRPALVVAGAEDTISLPACRELAERLPRAELVVIPDAGHVVNLSAPRAFDAAVAPFLDGLPPIAAPRPGARPGPAG